MSEWVDINEQIPDEDDDVLMIRENLSMGVGCIICCKSYIRLRFSGESKPIDSWKIKVTHWMTLPNAPI